VAGFGLPLIGVFCFGFFFRGLPRFFALVSKVNGEQFCENEKENY